MSLSDKIVKKEEFEEAKIIMGADLLWVHNVREAVKELKEKVCACDICEKLNGGICGFCRNIDEIFGEELTKEEDKRT